MIKSIFKIFIGLLSIFLIFIVAFYFYGSSANQKKSAYLSISDEVSYDSSKDTFSILTYNLGYLSGMSNNQPVETDLDFFQENQNQLIEFIKNNDPDIIAFQEIDYRSARSFYGNQIDSVRMKTSLKNIANAVNWDKKYVPFPYWPISRHFGEILSGQSVASRFPIKSNDAIILSKREDVAFYYNSFYLDRLLQINSIQMGDRILYVMNVHLEAFDKSTREKQSITILNKYNELAEKHPVILLGDFNADVENTEERTINNILKGNFINKAVSDQAYEVNKNNYYTYSSEKPNSKIDYIFYNSNKINFINATVLRSAGQISDHLPIAMRFSFKED